MKLEMVIWMASVAGGFLLFLLRLLEKWRQLPPGPLGWPIVGSLFNVSGPQHRSFAKLAKKYGPIMYFQMGSRPIVVISNSQLAKEVFREHDIEFASRPHYSTAFKHISYNFHDLVFAPYGDHWRHLRRICTTELFTNSKVNMFSGIRKRELNAFATEVTKRAATGEAINLSLSLQELLTNLMTSVLFGKRFYSSEAPTMGEARAYRATWGMLAQESGKFYIGDFIPALRWIDYFRSRDHRMKATVMPAVEDLLTAIVEERRKQQHAAKSGTPRDFVDVLLSLSEQDNLSSKGIIAILQDMLLAGTGTSRATLEWGFSELMRHPHVVQKAQEELDHVVGKDRFLEESDLKKLPYIQALVKEIMRLHPAAPLGIPHSNPQAVKLSGYTIPPNSTLHVNIWAISRDPLVWNQPDEFRPQRFLGTAHDVFGQHFDLIPFSSGRRKCVGIPLALQHITFTLAYLLHRFEWALPPGKEPCDVDMSETLGLACLRTHPLLVTARPRLTTQ